MTASRTAGRAPAATPTSEYATPAEVSARWSVTADYLARKRYEGTGPKFLKIGRRVRYRWSDILAFEAENIHARTA